MSRPTAITVLALLLLLAGAWLYRPESPLPRPEGAYTLEGGALLDPEVEPAGIEARLQVLGTGGETVIDLVRPLDEHGRFYFERLPEGVASLALRVGRRATALTTVDGLLIQGPQDPRLEDIDLRGVLHVFAFEILDSLGEPVTEAALFWRPALLEGHDAPYGEWTIGPSPRTIMCEHDVLDVAVLARGARIEEQPGVAFSKTIHLREGLQVKIAVPPEVRPWERGASLTVSLQALRLDPRFANARRRAGHIHATTKEIEIGEEGVEVIVPEPGPYALHWRFYREVSGDSLIMVELSSVQGHVDVSERAHLTLFEPQFPMQQYRDVLEDR